MATYHEIYVNGERVAQPLTDDEYRANRALVFRTVQAFHRDYKVCETLNVINRDEFVTYSVRFSE